MKEKLYKYKSGYTIPLFIYGGFVTMKLWNWLLVPTTGVRSLGIIGGMAISLIIYYLTSSTLDMCVFNTLPEGEQDNLNYYDIVRDTTFLALGYIIHLLMRL